MWSTKKSVNSNDFEMAAQLDEDADHNPLIAACIHGDFRLVKDLVREGVDVNRAVTNALTPLNIAAPLGRCKIVRFLITSGADVNQTVINGRTAAHACVKAGQLKCLKMLVDNGARLDMKYKGMTPLQMASRKGRAELVDYFIRLPSCTRAARIEALELLGAAFVDMVDLQIAHFYWAWSLAARKGVQPGDNVPPKPEEPHLAFQVKEFQTEEELINMQFDMDESSMQSLLIRERVFGPQHSHTVTNVIRRATADAAEGNIDRSNTLMAYVLDTQQKYDGFGDWTLKKFCSLIAMFSKMMFEGSPVKYKHVMAVFIKIIDILERKMKPYEKHPWNSTTYSDDLHAIIRSVSILAQQQPSVSADDRLEFRNILNRFVHLNVRDHVGCTPLHVACLYETPHPPLDVVELLLEAGADPQAVTVDGDTPLHSVATNKHSTQHRIIKLLLSSGVHYDACNAEGKCFTELLDSEIEFSAVNPMDFCSLQCLSAKAVKRSGIPYHSKVPTFLAEFIMLH